MKPYRVFLVALLGLSSCNASPSPLPTPSTSTPRPPAVRGTPTAKPITPRPTASPVARARRPVQLPTPSPYHTRALTGGNLPLRMPSAPVRLVRGDPRIAPLQGKISRAQVFDAYDELSTIYVSLGRYDDAARTRRDEAAAYRNKGLEDAAIIREREAARYETDLRLFIDRLPNAGEIRTLHTGARLEPTNGAYIGAFIDREDALPHKYLDENFQTHRRAADWAELVGKPHASHFMYLRYGQKFPHEWVDDLKKAGAIPHIAWEPESLNGVQDNEYLRNFARAAAKVDWPIFFRFASEMNGKWTPYHGDPVLYREKFRLVNRVLHEASPLLATIWCVNNPPLGNIADYYPGDDGCDWVGVNFYSVPYYDNNRNRPAFEDTPLALLEPVYRMYAERKPIAICEFAASHRSIVDGKTQSAFSSEKLSTLYGALPRLYPRVKLIDWFSMNTIRYASPGKTRSNYSLGENTVVRAAYTRAISEDYFRGQWSSELGATPVPMPRKLSPNQTVQGTVVLSIWPKTYTARPKVYLKVAKQLLYAADTLGAHRIALDTSRLPVGKTVLAVYLYDRQNRFIKSLSVPVNVSR